MLGRIRRRLTMGYAGVLALILVLFSIIVLVFFLQRATEQQDKYLAQKADAEVKDAINGGDEYSFVEAPTKSDVAVMVFQLDSAGVGVLNRDSSGSVLGLPYPKLAREAALKKRAFPERKWFPATAPDPDGPVRVVSVPLINGYDEPLVVQAAQSRGVVWRTVGNLALVLALVGFGALLLSAFGGLFMARRAMRPAETAFERQRAFIADASHELKTPLTLIRADAEVLSRGLTDPDRRELADDLLLETDRMNALLSDLLTLARLDAGRLSVERETFDLAGVIAETSERFAARAEAEGKKLEVHLGEGKIPARGDAARTAQILVALLDNALRYTPPGGLVTVEGRTPDGRAEASVSDTGPGIAPEHLGRIFDRFYRAEEARTRAPSGGGTGLGLAIARDLARHMGGDLLASNAEGLQAGSGASFTLALPAGS